MIYRYVAALFIGLSALTSAHAQTRFADNDPVIFTGKSPHRYAIHGIDVARFQHDVDWHAVQRSGVNFVFIKATEGGDLLDPQFKINWRGTRRAGIQTGAYHFYYFCTTAATQAKWFIRNVPRRKGSLPPVLDMEWNPFSPTCTLRPPAAQVRANAREFIRIVTAHYGTAPILYTTPNFYVENDMGRVKGVDFWLRTTAKTPAQAYPRAKWAFWQYTSTGVIPGIDKETDINVFNGSAGAWKKWLSRRQQK